MTGQARQKRSALVILLHQKKKILIHMTILKPDRVGQLGVDGRSPPGSLKQYNNIMTVQEVILYRSLQYSTTRCRP